MSNPTVVLAVLATLVFVGLALEELFRRTGIPDVLVLLGLGIAVSASGLVHVEDLRSIEKVFTTGALVLILFEGAIQLRLADLRSGLAGSLKLTIAGFVITSLVVAGIGMLLGMRPLAGLLLGAILGGTSSAVVIPVVSNIKLERDTRTILTLESALTDVLCIVFALALLGALTAESIAWGSVGAQLGIGFFGALAFGAAMGLLWAFGMKALRQRRVSFVALGAAVFLVYALAEGMGTFGAIACLAFGVVLGNAPSIAAKAGAAGEGLELAQGERLFLAEVAFLLKICFFVYLGIALDLTRVETWIYGLLVTAVIFAARPLAVWLGLSRSTTPRRDARVASALVPKGLAPAVLATLPVQAGIAEGLDIEAATVGTILFSITLASGLVFLIEHPVVRGIYDRFLRGYPESVAAPAPVVALVPAEDGEPAEVAEQQGA